MKKKRTNIYFSESMLKDLAGEARRLGISVAAVVRKAVEDYMKEVRAHLSK